MTSLALAVPLTVVSVLGLLLNIYILFMVLVTKQVQTANNLLLLHLGAVDSLLCVTFLVFSAPDMLKWWPWLALGIPCNLHGFLFTLLHPVALWTVCGLNCDRYYAITSPLHYGSVVNPRKVVIGLGFTWLVSFVLCIPPLFLVAPYRFNPGLGGCAPDFAQKEGTIWYSLTYTTFTLLLPAILILGCNLRVLMIARYHRHRIASAIFEVTISAQVTITHQRNPFLLPSSNIFRGRRAISNVLQLIGSLLLLYFPYYGVILWESSSSLFIGDLKANSTRFYTLFVTFASTLLNCSPPVNGLLYGVKSKILRKSFQNYWRKQMSKNEMNQEIQARTPSTCGSRRPSLTPLGILAKPSSSQLQRRSSEAYLERQSNSNRSSIQRIASGLTWRPQSTTGIDLVSSETLQKTKAFRNGNISKHSSCNVLQVPKEKDLLPVNQNENFFPSYKLFKMTISKNLLDSQESDCQLTASNNHSLRNGTKGNRSKLEYEPSEKSSALQMVFSSSPKKSPKILITRAHSEDSEQHPSRTKCSLRALALNRSYSSTMVEKKWKKLRYLNEKDTKAKQDSETRVKVEVNSSGSNSEEESDNGGLCISFNCDPLEGPPTANLPEVSRERKCTGVNGPLYLFSWPIRRKSNTSCGHSSVLFARSVADLGAAREYQL